MGEEDIPASTRVGLCWPSANRDETVFVQADEVLDRAPVPMSVGFGIHNCLGAPQARLIIRVFEIARRTGEINSVDFSGAQNWRKEESFTRQFGCDQGGREIVLGLIYAQFQQ